MPPLPTEQEISLGKIKVGEEIGHGGFGVVHEATIAGIDFPFAIKFLDPSQFNSNLANARTRFFREAETLFRLRHPHIIAIYGVGEHQNKPYILMERFDGVSLRKVRDVHSDLPPQRILSFIGLVASALAHAHDNNVIHRDIKPSNLMTAKRDARVLDFGIAGILDPDNIRLTRTGGTCVGGAFTAPELRADPRLLTPACDVYSLGACWFWLLTGMTPEGLEWETALDSGEVSPAYRSVLLRCMAQASNRYSDMTALIREIGRLQAGESPDADLPALTDNDIKVLAAVLAICGDPGTVASYKNLKSQSGVRQALIPIAIKNLEDSMIIEKTMGKLPRGGESFVCWRMTPSGMTWAAKNQNRIDTVLTGDRIPF